MRRSERLCHRGSEAVRGFTLIEVLIVISIIAILASLVIGGLGIAQRRARETHTRSEVTMMLDALENYRLDEGEIPGFLLDPDPERNDFHLLFNALMDTPQPKGKGGRSAPYLEKITPKQIVVRDEITGEYRQVTRKERYINSIPKYIIDPWGQPYIYRCNKGLKRQDWMSNPDGVDLYSLGPNEEDDTILGDDAGEEPDDIGNV